MKGLVLIGVEMTLKVDLQKICLCISQSNIKQQKQHHDASLGYTVNSVLEMLPTDSADYNEVGEKLRFSLDDILSIIEISCQLGQELEIIRYIATKNTLPKKYCPSFLCDPDLSTAIEDTKWLRNWITILRLESLPHANTIT
ncbi:hypothetical protein PHYBLDRAFT_60313 [Phycomyces blakesleeanus NRRL 1555(-)]|uniref:Uncharacterized protein n=1 Tax=Phycomyces blakesleeanus (strain ATCC 8743b / DSM 1359 / FGSC 10004 / NBRC 33097 / NRRL 1555) TaxID=763407 RepID=A0A162ZZA1_PHYB8|nr:hypothetical protein PHYBLDRAFT_60313 [Phycomyces blakesleeanus NRRL 1555(-)]OAD69991.1 hypothetical protein PHYBLDRAFT_60313 [Phycomyces blakesleeanus NRRL 1555(-)]|eukprot:XP_018288031.1 hypothetical protein PHYBLDRAFT_60313 [Phycomyces blakesleeanus NRRL 1555(-)]